MMQLSRTAARNLPTHRPGSPIPGWLRDAQIGLVLGRMPVIPRLEMEEAPDHLRVAAVVEGLIWAWKCEGRGRWTLVSVYDGPVFTSHAAAGHSRPA